jgi:hypothetical protein
MHAVKWVALSLLVSSSAFSAEGPTSEAQATAVSELRSVVGLQSVSVMNDDSLSAAFELEAPIPAIPLSLGLVLPLYKAAPESSLGLQEMLVKLQVDGLAWGAVALKPALGVWLPMSGLSGTQSTFEPSLKAQADLADGVATELVALVSIPMTEGAPNYGAEAALVVDVLNSGLALENRLFLGMESSGALDEVLWRPQLSYGMALSPSVTLTPAVAALVGVGPSGSSRGFYGALGFEGALY